jgi:hypothetical protein
MNSKNIIKYWTFKLLCSYSVIIDYSQYIIQKYKNIKYNFNKIFLKNKLVSLEYINLSNNKIEILTTRPSYLFRNVTNYKLNYYKSLNNSNYIFMLNFCNTKGKIKSFILTNKQFRILSKNKKFINHGDLINLINNLNNNNHHINLLHSAINNIEITGLSQKYIKSLDNITVDNFIKFLKIKYFLYVDTVDSDLIIMDSDFLDEYIFKVNDIISFSK